MTVRLCLRAEGLLRLCVELVFKISPISYVFETLVRSARIERGHDALSELHGNRVSFDWLSLGRAGSFAPIDWS